MIKPLKIHSAYNPQKEAERFCESIKIKPKIILITEPGESYLVPFLRKKFPNSKLIAIRYTNTYFLDSDKFWDSVWRPINGNLDFFLVNNIPDEFLMASVFLPWKPAERIWPELASKTWKSIASAIKIIHSIIATRNFFGRRWYKNIVNNFLFSKNIIDFKFTNEDTFLVAAGPSLQNTLDYLTNNRNELNQKFIFAVSSATPALLARNIRPDLCISTDGGFWAANHLKNLPPDIPLAFPAEANIPLKILNKNPCVFLHYGSSIESFFLNEFKIEAKRAKRNGTVSGTATDLVLDYTKGNIYISGLDLKGSKGFAHVQPYENQKTQEFSFNKLNPVANFAALSNLDCRSLKTYAQWFSQIPINRSKRIFRVGNKGCKIENIKIISEDDFVSNSKNYKKIIQSKNHINMSLADKKHSIIEFYNILLEDIESDVFVKNLKENLFNIKLTDKNIHSMEKEFCELISFTNCIQFIKKIFTSENQNSIEIQYESKKIKTELSNFIRAQIKRLKNE